MNTREARMICLKCPHVQPPPYAGTVACTVSGKDIRHHADAAYCPAPDGARFGDGKYPLGWESRGVGDTVAKFIHVVTLGLVKPCGACEEERTRLNEKMPYRSNE